MNEGFLTRAQVLAIVKASRSSVDRWEASGLFPRRRQLGPRRVGWSEAEVREWVQTRPAVGAGAAA